MERKLCKQEVGKEVEELIITATSTNLKDVQYILSLNGFEFRARAGPKFTNIKKSK